MSSYRICVTSGYPFGGRGGFESEAIVYGTGGRVFARFVCGTGRDGRATPAKARARAEAWIAADDATRREMQSYEHNRSDKRTWAWRRWLS